MQILSHTYELNELLNSETFKRKIKNFFAKDWIELLKYEPDIGDFF